MKDFFKSLFLIGGCLFFIPLFIVYVTGNQNQQLAYHINQESISAQDEGSTSYLVEQDKLIGILAKEIPYNYEYETIKAQAVICRTYMARRILGIQTKGDLVGYTKEELQQLWKEDFTTLYETYAEAVKDTENEIIVYDHEPIEALYHKASGGSTRDAKAVYGVDVPYLKAVASPKDHIIKQITIKKTDMSNALRKVYPEILIEDKTLEKQIQIIEKDAQEYVKSMQIGNQMIEGEVLKDLLELPSSHFKIFNSGDSLIFDVSGIGHGVGFSQNGANEEAKEGKTYKEMIQYYYEDVTIENYSYKK